MGKFVVALDGHSSTGKSTLAKRLAKALQVIHIDTGAMYRAITLFAIRNNWTSNGLNTSALINSLNQLSIGFNYNAETNTNEVLLNGENVEEHIRKPEVSAVVSEVAALPQVREMLVKIQREIGDSRSLIMDGRDIGTHVFPDADIKIFLTSSAEERAKRRFKELTESGVETTFEAVLKNIEHRDHIDSTRATNPLRIAEDAIVIDNGLLSKDETFAKAIEIVRRGIS